MEITEQEEYTISNDDIKFPTFFDKSLIANFRKAKITKETLIQDITQVVEKLDDIIKHVSEMINKNVNNFRVICDSYKLNSYDFFVLFKLLKEFVTAIKIKIENKNINEFKIPSFDDYFKDIQIMDVIKNQYKVVDTKYEIIKAKVDSYINEMKNVLGTNHQCGILFMSYVFKYYYTILIKAKKQIDLFYKIKPVTEDVNSKLYHSNMIIFFDLITIFKILQNSEILLSNSYFMDKDDLYNSEEDSEEWTQIKKKYLEFMLKIKMK